MFLAIYGAHEHGGRKVTFLSFLPPCTYVRGNLALQATDELWAVHCACLYFPPLFRMEVELTDHRLLGGQSIARVMLVLEKVTS